MSATLDAAPIAEYLRNCPVIRSEGKLFDVRCRTPHMLRFRSSVRSPSASEDRGRRRCARLFPGLPKFTARFGNASSGPYPRSSPDPALRRPVAGRTGPRCTAGGPTKSHLSTNVAESSITIEGVTTVIDSGLARISRRFALDRPADIECPAIGKASAIQRAGRAGRTRPGRSDPPLFLRGLSTPARSRCS